MTSLNYWHIVGFLIILGAVAYGVKASLEQDKQKTKLAMLASVIIIGILFLPFSVIVVDKYTKKVNLYKLKNKRLLSTEQIVYSGIVRNDGNHDIGEVTFEIKLVNKGHVTGNVKGGNFFKASGFLNFFTGGYNRPVKAQTIIKEFVVAKNLEPGKAKAFRVYFPFPPHFRSVSQFSKVYGH